MKCLVLASLFLLSPLAAKAEVFSCNFTEPFYTVTYATGTQILTISDFEHGETVFKNVGFLVKGPGEFELRMNGEPYMTLSLTNQGSDGMSDYIYPYEGKMLGKDDNANSGVGGCESLLLKKKK
jgi:uncharacterized membrane protein